MENNSEKNSSTYTQPFIKDHDVIYALRAAHQHQSQLLVLADQKANILVGILAVILTIIFTKADYLANVSNGFLIPLAIFLLLEIVALLLALLVIMPKSAGRLNVTKIENIPNPLFFGYFTMFREDEYLEYLFHKMSDSKSARYLLAKDLYQAGSILRKKYLLLKYTYILAVTGVILLASSTVVFMFIR